MSGKSRSRHYRGHTHHEHREPLDERAVGDMPTRDQIRAVFDVDAAYKAQLSQLRPEEMLAYLNTMPAEGRKFILASLGVGAARQASRAAAAQLVARLSAGGSRRDELVSSLFVPVVWPFGAELATSEWADLLGDDTHAAMRVLVSDADALLLASTQGSGEEAVIKKVSLIAALDAGLAGSAIALAFLAADDEPAADAYASLRLTHPKLPGPRDAVTCSPRARLAEAGIEWPEDDPDLTEQRILLEAEIGNHDGLSKAGLGEMELLMPIEATIADETAPLDPDLAAQLLDDRWLAAWGAFTDQAVRMSNGQLPDRTAVGQIARFTKVIWLYADRLAAQDRKSLREAIAILRESGQPDPARAWLLRLAALVGPEHLTEEIDQVSELSTTAAGVEETDDDAALEALLRLIDLAGAAASGQVPDVDALFHAQQDARAGLPTYGRLIYAASTGTVVVPPAPEVAREPDEDASAEDSSTSERTPDATNAAPEQAEDDDLEGDNLKDDELKDETRAADEPAQDDDVARLLIAEQRSAPAEQALEVALEGASQEAPEDAPDAAADGETPSDQDDLESLKASALAFSQLRRYSAQPQDAEAELAVDDVAHAPAAPAQSESTPTTSSADPDLTTLRDDWDGAVIRAIERDLISAGRFALAADLATATNAPQASVAARQIAAYAQAVRTATGEMAAAFSERTRHVVREDLGDDRPGQLLAWAAAAKMAVLAPPAGPADTLLNLTPCIEQSAALLEVTAAFVEAARGGVVVVAPEAARAAGALSAAQARTRELSQAANERVSNSKHRTIKYLPANEVYQRWIAPDGALGTVLEAVRDNETTRAQEVSKLVVESLRGKGEKNMDAVFRTFSNRSTKQITAGPRLQLLDRWDEIITLCSQWVAACDEVTALGASARTDSWQYNALARLRDRIEPHRDNAIATLTAWEEREGIDGDNGAAALLADAFAACDGDLPEGDEPRRAYAEHAELLGLPVTLDAATLLPADLTALRDQIIDLARAPELTPDEVYAGLAARAAHDLSEVLVAGVRATAQTDGARLEAQRNRDLIAVDLVVRDEIDALHTEIDMRRLTGQLADEPWSRASARVGQLADATRRDYERIRASLADITTELDAERATRIAAARERIEAIAPESEDVADQLEQLLALCEDGQLASAEEQLQQALEGDTFSETEAHPEHLQRFFPAVPDILAAHPDAVRQIATHLRDQVDTPVTLALREHELDLFALSGNRTDQAKLALSAWGRLTSKSPVAGAPDQESIAHVLRQAGLEFRSHIWDKGANRNKQWITLNQVKGLGKALTPVLGSGMSPGESSSLRVLLVRQNTTPATVIEWMSGEPSDRTILTLWLQPTALTAAEWRAVGDASRGRKNPPVVMFDLGTLLYLSTQAEPRITTLASLALPFTASNPYRDTPGDAAPEMFFGRTEERADVMDMRGSSFVSGGRQLGKTTLLQDAARRFTDMSEHHIAVFLSIYSVGKVNATGVTDPPARVWNHVWPALAACDIVPVQVPHGDLAGATTGHIRNWLAKDERRQLLILLDEADDFLDADSAQARFDNVEVFRSLMLGSGRRVKVVLAGLHRTARFESLPNQPLSHLGRPIVVGPLRPQHAYDLLTSPMAAMGYVFDSPLTIARALATANNMPAQLQLLGASLVDHMTRKPFGTDGPPAVITADDVAAAFDQRLQALFREKFTLTLTLDPRYKVIAYVVAHAAHERGVDASLTLAELSSECRNAWPEGFAGVSADYFRGLVNECVDLGVLAQDATRFRLRTPTVLRLLGTDVEVFDELVDASDKLVVPSVSDGGAFRQAIDDNHSSPLTSRQIGALLKLEHAVTVIAGSPATGLPRVLAALEKAAEEVPTLTVTRCNSPSDVPLMGAIKKAAGHTWLLLDASHMNAAQLKRVLTIANTATQGTSQPVRMIIVAGPDSAAAWAEWPTRVDLERFEPQGLSMYADVNSLPYHEPAKVAQLLAATGGWPNLITQLTATVRDPNSREDAQGLLEGLAGELSENPGALSAMVGLNPGNPSALASVFEQVIEFTKTPEPIDDLAELLDALGDATMTALAREHGYTDSRTALDALLALGALIPDAEGRVSAEPVLLADFERARR